jgi:LmbE family N-acetylglucosaminyl deacetylase
MIRIPFHPRAWIDTLLTYPRFLGTIKPELMASASNQLSARLDLYAQSWWPKQLEPPLGKRILAISPHPDDEAIGCGGLLSAHSIKAQIRIVNIYNGDGGGALEEGPWRNDPSYRERLVRTGSRELQAAAKAFGACHVDQLGISDCDGEPGDAEVEALRTIIDAYGPDVVALPWLLDNHPHHRKTNDIFAQAARNLDCMVLGYEIWSLLTPNAYLDITSSLEKKLEAIALYKSQLRTIDYVAFATSLARVRAFQFPVNRIRTGAVEAYVALPCRDYFDLVEKVAGDESSHTMRRGGGRGVL